MVPTPKSPRLAVQTSASRLGRLGPATADDAPEDGNRAVLRWSPAAGAPDSRSRSPVQLRTSWYGPARSADRPGSEAAVQALSGLMQVHGRDGGTPRRIGVEIASVAAGVLGAQGVLAAAIGRSRGGRFSGVETSVLQAGLLLLSHYFVVATRLGDALPGPAGPAPGPPFRSSDGSWFEIETLDPEAWRSFWILLGAGEADLGRAWTTFRWRYDRAACSFPPGLHEATRRGSLAEATDAARASGVSLARLRGYREVLDDLGGWRGHPVAESAPADAAGDPPPPLAAPSDPDLPLSGLRVVEATSRIQGPFAGMLLRMMGAEVTRVRPPGGDYGRAGLCLNRGKEQVDLDLGFPADRTELGNLVADAAVFLHNWRPGRAAGWGLGWPELAARNPGLVYAEASGWGERGGHGLLGTDFLVQAHTGMGEGLTPEGELPAPSRMILVDLMGALVTCEGILTGLYRRQRDQRGCRVETSLLAGAVTLQAHVLDGLVAGKQDGRRAGRPVWGPLDRPVPASDGVLALTVDDDEAFRRLCELTGQDADGAGREETERALAERIAGEPVGVWEQRLAGAGIAGAAACTDLAGPPADPRLTQLFEPVGGEGRAPKSPWRFVP